MLNKVILIGRLVADPENKYFPSGDQVSNIRLVTSRKWKDKTTNERKEEAEYHRVVFFSGLAKTVEKYLKKGSLINVEGRLRTTKWTDKDGHDRYTTEIVAETMLMLDKKTAGQQEPASPSYDDFDDNIPF